MWGYACCTTNLFWITIALLLLWKHLKNIYILRIAVEKLFNMCKFEFFFNWLTLTILCQITEKNKLSIFSPYGFLNFPNTKYDSWRYWTIYLVYCENKTKQTPSSALTLPWWMGLLYMTQRSEEPPWVGFYTPAGLSSVWYQTKHGSKDPLWWVNILDQH